MSAARAYAVVRALETCADETQTADALEAYRRVLELGADIQTALSRPDFVPDRPVHRTRRAVAVESVSKDWWRALWHARLLDVLVGLQTPHDRVTRIVAAAGLEAFLSGRSADSYGMLWAHTWFLALPYAPLEAEIEGRGVFVRPRKNARIIGTVMRPVAESPPTEPDYHGVHVFKHGVYVEWDGADFGLYPWSAEVAVGRPLARPRENTLVGRVDWDGLLSPAWDGHALTIPKRSDDDGK